MNVKRKHIVQINIDSGMGEFLQVTDTSSLNSKDQFPQKQDEIKQISNEIVRLFKETKNQAKNRIVDELEV